MAFGSDTDDKNIRYIKYRPAYINGNWKEWFAWRPVKIHQSYYWLTTVYRREIIPSFLVMDHEYGTILDVLKNADDN